MRNPVTLSGNRNPVSLGGVRNPVTIRGNRNPVDTLGVRNPVTFIPGLEDVLNSEAQSYFDRSGVTDPTGKGQINSFITNSKSGGYWELMDEAWLLRSTQNSGSGVTAFALKSNSNNGTLVNSPIWVGNGITFLASSSQKITTTFTPTGGEVTVLGTHNPAAGSASLTIAAQDDITNRRWELIYEGSIDSINWFVFNPSFIINTIASAEAAFRSVIGRCGAAINKVHDFVNAETSTTVGAVSSSGAQLWIGARQNGSGDMFYNGTISHVLYFSTVLTDGQKSHLYDNIKTTIGSGLGLP